MSRKNMLIFLVMACFVFTIPGMTFGASIVGSKHDFSYSSENPGVSYFAGNFLSDGNDITEPCVFCHTPHNASPVGFLWNRTNYVTTSYNMYSSSTLSVVPDTGAPTGLTLMCMSCHDGVTSIAVGQDGYKTMINAPGNPGTVTMRGGGIDRIGDVYFPSDFSSDWGANIGNLTPGYGGSVGNLGNDHPVSFEWVDNIPGIKDPIEWTGEGLTALRLFGGTRRMECSTCHNVHDSANQPFLRMSNTGSNMCTTCHDK